MKPKLHPELQKVQDIWKQIKILKEEDRGKYAEFMLPLPNESQAARNERQIPFIKGFYNPSNMLLRSKGDAIFKKEVQRNSLSKGQEGFVGSADKSGQALQEMVQNEVAPTLAAYGTVCAVLDKPTGQMLDKEQELREGKPFLTILDPGQLIDFAWGEDGALLWFKYYVDSPADRSDPWNPKKTWKTDQGIALWTRKDFSIRAPGTSAYYQAPTPNSFGFVPVVIQSQFVEPNKTIGASTFFASSDYLLTGNNLDNAANMEVFKNASATLLMNTQDYGEEDQPRHEKNPDTNLKHLQKQTHDIKNVLLYSNPQDRPSYLARNLELVQIAAERAQKYFDRAIDNEKHVLSAKTLKAPQSGVSKAYDFDDVNSMLTAFAAALERFEQQAVRMAGEMMDEEDKSDVVYPPDFDVRSFNERLEFIKSLKDAGYSSKIGMREAYKSLTPEISQVEAIQKQINAEIDADPLEPTQPPAAAGGFKPHEKEVTRGNP